MIAQWIAEGSVPSYPAFVKEDVRKRKKRQRKFEKEEEECEQLKKELGLKQGIPDYKITYLLRDKTCSINL